MAKTPKFWLTFGLPKLWVTGTQSFKFESENLGLWVMAIQFFESKSKNLDFGVLFDP